MYYTLTKLALRVVRWAARRACKNPSPGAWQHLVKDAQGDLRWDDRPAIKWTELPVHGQKPNRFIDLQR